MKNIMTSVTTAVTLTTKLIGLASIAKDADAQLVVAELKIELAKLKTDLAKLIEENQQLESDLKNAQSKKTAVEYRDGLYYKLDGDGPFCTMCYEDKNKLKHVVEAKVSHQNAHVYYCKSCNETYKKQ